MEQMEAELAFSTDREGVSCLAVCLHVFGQKLFHIAISYP